MNIFVVCFHMLLAHKWMMLSEYKCWETLARYLSTDTNAGLSKPDLVSSTFSLHHDTEMKFADVM